MCFVGFKQYQCNPDGSKFPAPCKSNRAQAGGRKAKVYFKMVGQFFKSNNSSKQNSFKISPPRQSNNRDFSGHYNADDIKKIISDNLQAAADAWAVLPEYWTPSKDGYSLADLFAEGKFKGNGESVHGCYCPICCDAAADDRCKLIDNGSAIFCRECQRQGKGNKGQGVFGIFDAVQAVENCDYCAAVDKVGAALAAAGYIAPCKNPTEIKNAVNGRAGGGVPVIKRASELVQKASDQPPAAAPADDLPATIKRLPVLPVDVDKNWKIKPRAGAGQLPKLHLEIKPFPYGGAGGGTAPKRRAELFDDQGRRYAFYDAEKNKWETKLVKNPPGFKFATADPYDLRLLIPNVQRVLIVESEKTVDIVNELYKGKTIALALNGSSGARQWGRFADRFNGRAVIVCADADQAGIESASLAVKSILSADKNTLQEVGLFSPNAPGNLDTFPGYGLDDLIGDLRQQYGGIDDRVISELDDLLSKAPKFNLETLPRLPGNDHGDDLPAADGELTTVDEIDEQAAIELRRQVNEAQKAQRLKLELESESLDDFDYERLPGAFKYALQHAVRFGVDPMLEVLPCLTTLINFSGQKIAIYEPSIHRRKKARLYPRINTVLLGGSNSGKSPIIKELATAPIEDIEETENNRLAILRQEQNKSVSEQINDIDDKLTQLNEARENGELTPEKENEYNQQEKALKAEKTRIKNQAKKDAIPDNPHFILAADSGQSLEYDVGLLQASGYWNGATVAADEAGPVFTISGNVRQEFTRFQFYTDLGEPGGKLANHGTLTTENVKKLNLRRKLTLGYLFGVQPEIFGSYLGNDLLRAQGFANRFFKLYLPDEKAPENEDIETAEYYDAFAAPYYWLYQLPIIEEVGSYLFKLLPDAQDIFKQYKRQIEVYKTETYNKGLTDEAAFLGKTNTYLLSIAAGLKIVELSERIEYGEQLTPDNLKKADTGLFIDGEIMQLAVDLTTAAIKKTLAAMRAVRVAVANGPAAATALNEIDEKVLEIIRKAGEKGVTASEIRNVVNYFKDKDKGKERQAATINKLRKAGLVKTDERNGKRGGRYYFVELQDADQDSDQDGDQDE